VSASAVHAELDEIERRHPGRLDVDGRLRKVRHGLRLVAGGDRSALTVTALQSNVADLHRVTREGGQ
jgi:hypothetical protein